VVPPYNDILYYCESLAGLISPSSCKKLETAILSNAESSPFDIITSSTERRTPK